MRASPATLALAFVVLTAARAASADDAPLVLPQWLAAQTEDALVFDRIAASGDPVSIALPNGDTVTATITNDEVVLRRYSAAGTVLASRAVPFELDGSAELVLRADAAHDAYYVLAGGSQTPATLMRLDEAFEPAWSVSLPDEAICERDGACLRLELLDDGSMLAMRAYRLMRIAGDGVVQWSVIDPGASSAFEAGDLAIGATAIWVATSGAAATLARFDFDGTRLSADVSSCQGCGGATWSDIEATGDGGARVVGSIGAHMVYARYDALGFPLLQTSGDAGEYVRLDEDGGGATYVLATSWEGDTARRIDPATGSVSWSVQADDFVAHDAGIATLRNTSTTLEAAAWDAAGAPLWQRALTAQSSLSWRVATHPAFVEGHIELLARDLAPSDEPCANYPRVVRLDGAGNPVWFDRPCRTESQSAEIWSIDAQAGTGVLVDTLAHLALYSPNGDLRWRAHACGWCSGTLGPSVWPAAVIARDGGVWALRWDDPSNADPDGRTLIERYDPSGNLVFATESLVNGGSVGNYYDDIAIRTGDTDLVMLFGSRRVLYWQRVADDGSQLAIRTLSISDDYFHIADARRLADGSTVVLTKGWGYCSVGCPPFYVTVLRIAQNGDLLARYEFPEAYAPWIRAAVDIDGDTFALLPLGDAPLGFRRIRADGSVDADIPLDELGGGLRPEFLAGSNDRWLLEADTIAAPGVETLRLFDDGGHLLASRFDAPYLAEVRPTAFGFFTIAWSVAPVDEALLLDPLTLADTVRFYTGSTGELYGPRKWQVVDDGSVYGTIVLAQSGTPAIARFSVPGTTSDVIFRNAFD